MGVCGNTLTCPRQFSKALGGKRVSGSLSVVLGLKIFLPVSGSELPHSVPIPAV